MACRTTAVRCAAFAVGLVLSTDARGEDRSLDSLKLPPGTVILISPNPAAASPPVGAVVLSPEEYRKLLDSAEKLRQLSEPGRPETPSVCRLAVAIEQAGDSARVRVTYQFRTERIKSMIALGLQNARPVSAAYEGGRLAFLEALPDGGGFAARVESSGEYRLTVEADLTVAQHGMKGLRGFELGLPGAAVTIVERLTLPAGAAKARVNGKPVPALSSADTAIILGAAPRLEATWDTPPAGPGDPAVAAEGRMDVTVEEKAIVTNVRLTLQVLRGTVGEFRIQAPATATVTAGRAAVERPDNARSSIWVIRRPASAEDQVIEVKYRQVIGKTPVMVNAVGVAGGGQRGTLVLAAPTNLRLSTRTYGDVALRGPSPAPPGERQETYDYMLSPNVLTLVDVNPQAAKGDLEVIVGHELKFTERGWRLTARFDLKPVRQQVDRFDIELPAGLENVRLLPADVAELVGPVREVGGGRVQTVRLAEPARQQLAVTLEGEYLVPPSATSAVLDLPRPLGLVERGGQVTAGAPDGFEVRGSVRAWERERPGEWERPLEAVEGGRAAAAVDTVPARVELGWWRTAVGGPARAVVDVQLSGREAEVRHVVSIPGPAWQVALRGPADLAGRVEAIAGGALMVGGPGEWLVRPTSARDVELTLKYAMPLADGGAGDVALPLLWPAGHAQCDTEVRVWSAPGGFAELAGGPWVRQPVRPVADRARLPDLVARSAAPGAALRLRRRESANDETSFVIDRAWVQAACDDPGTAVRARYVVRPLRPGTLTFELPGPAAVLGVSASLDGQRAEPAPGGRTVSFRLEPDPGRPVRVVEVAYRTAARPGRTWAVEPPRPTAGVFVGAVRWQLLGPPDDVALNVWSDVDVAGGWGWSGPRPAWTTDQVALWLGGEGRASETAFDTDGLAGTTAGLRPVRLLLVPRIGWTLAASLAALGMGLVLAGFAWTPRRIGWAAMAAVAFFAALIVCPQPVAALAMAAAPGAAVASVAVAALTAGRRRQRARSVFAPIGVVVRSPRLGRTTPAPSKTDSRVPVARAAG